MGSDFRHPANPGMTVPPSLYWPQEMEIPFPNL